MIHYKTPEEIETMTEGGKRLHAVVGELIPWIKIGMSTLEIDRKATSLIKKNGGEISFNKVKGYDWATCLTINEQVVHTPPSKRIIKDQDVLTIDIGLYYEGYHTDYADTIVCGNPKNNEVVHFLNVGKRALYKAIDQAKKGNRLGDISRAIENEIYGNGYKIVKQLTGHGIGTELHEDPNVFGFLDRPIQKTLTIKSGLVIAIEVIYSESSEEFAYEDETGWSLITKDRSLSACFEHTVAITDTETRVLT